MLKAIALRVLRSGDVFIQTLTLDVGVAVKYRDIRRGQQKKKKTILHFPVGKVAQCSRTHTFHVNIVTCLCGIYGNEEATSLVPRWVCQRLLVLNCAMGQWQSHCRSTGLEEWVCVRKFCGVGLR